MIPFCCFRCFQNSFTPDRICCFRYNYVEESTTSIIENVQPAVTESGNASSGYYVSMSDAFTQANDDDFSPVEPTRDASTETTNCDFRFLDQTVGCHEYKDGYKIIYASEVRAMKVFDQHSDDNHSLQPENSKYCNVYGINIDNCNKATEDSLIDSLNNAPVARKQWTNLNELPESDECLNICNSKEIFNQRTGYAEQINNVGNLNFAGSVSYQSECTITNTYLGRSKKDKKFGDIAEKSSTNLILPKKRNNSCIDNHYKRNSMLKKAALDQEAHISIKSRRNLFKQKVPEKRLPESGKLSLAGSISYQSECSLPNTYLERSKKENTLGDSAEKSNTNPILPKKINNSYSNNHYEGKSILKKAVLDQKAHSSVKSRRNLFKQKVPKKRLLECGKLNLAGSSSNQSECSLPNTNLESSKNENTFEDNSEKSNSYLVLPEKRKNSSNYNHYEGNHMLRKADFDHSSRKSRRNIFKQKVPKKRSLECGKRISLETMQKKAIAVPFHLEKEAILRSATSLKKMRPLKNHFSERRTPQFWHIACKCIDSRSTRESTTEMWEV